MAEIKTLISFLLLSPMILPMIAAVGLVFQKNSPVLLFVKISLFVFLILSLPITENKIAEYWESSPPLLLQRIQSFLPQAIVVIGGGLEHAALEYGSEATVNRGTLLRLRYAAKLARDTGLPVLTSGGGEAENSVISEANLMAMVLQTEFAVPVTWQEIESRNTLENARFSRRILQQSRIDRIILVTQAYHMPRADLEFRKAGFQVLAAPTTFIHMPHSGFLWTSLIPSVKALENMFLIVHESVGMLWYSLHD